jgi:hypothetical protein
MKKIVIVILVVLAMIAAAAFIYRYQILQYSAERFLKSILPHYARIDGIAFEPSRDEVIFKGFKILNPAGFSARYLLEIENLTCHYRMRGKTMLDGFDVMDAVFKNAVLNVERLKSGRSNIEEMKGVTGVTSGVPAEGEGAKRKKASGKRGGGKKFSDVIRLPEAFTIRGGSFVFIDKLNRSRPTIISLDSINALLDIKFNDSYSGIVDAKSEGKGIVNGDADQIVNWTVAFNPNTPKLTMSNRFEVSGVDILTFEPYYDRYSPLVFKKGRFSGTLIFDFDNGNIGSTNEVHLSGLEFYVKPGHENTEFWGSTVPELVKYFRSSFGDIVFDFKIKGDMAAPQFYLGPISKQALTSMAIDKISAAIEKASSGKPGDASEKSDIEKAGEYIKLFKEMMKKK